MKDIELIRNLKSTGKSFFSLSDLEKITELERNSLYVALTRWVKKGVLERAARNVYVITGEAVRTEIIAGQLYFPCYLSFEAALSRLGVLNLVPYSLTFATTKKTKTLTLLGRKIDYRHITEDLFFGFVNVDGLYIAEAEKAMLDLVYFSTFGKASLPLDEIDLRSLSVQTLRDYAARFPSRVAKALEQLSIEKAL